MPPVQARNCSVRYNPSSYSAGKGHGGNTPSTPAAATAILHHPSKVFRGKTGVFGDATHRESVDGVRPGNHDASSPVSHNDMPALPRDAETKLLQDTHRVLVSDTGKLGHGRQSDRHQLPRELYPLGLQRRFLILRRDLLPKHNCFANIGQRLAPCSALAPTPRQRRATHSKPLPALDQFNRQGHERINHPKVGRAQAAIKETAQNTEGKEPPPHL